MDLENFAQLFETFKECAFRLELLDQYSVPEEEQEFQLFLNGHPVLPTMNREWAEMVERATKAGKIFQRVHVIPERLTPYLRFEIEWGYAYSAIVGEDIRLLQRRQAKLPENIRDYWLFDRSTLVSMQYGVKGEFLGVEQITDSDRIQNAIALSRRLLEQAEPLSVYFARIRQGG